MSTTWLDRLEDYWRRLDLLHDRRVTEADIAIVEGHFGVVFPDDLRAYFLRLNGTKLGQCQIADEQMISFWYLDELASMAEERLPVLPDADRWVVFGDYSIWAFAYAIRLSPDRRDATPIALAGGPTLCQIAESLEEFFEGYLRKDRTVLFGPT